MVRPRLPLQRTRNNVPFVGPGAPGVLFPVLFPVRLLRFLFRIAGPVVPVLIFAPLLFLVEILEPELFLSILFPFLFLPIVLFFLSFVVPFPEFLVLGTDPQEGLTTLKPFPDMARIPSFRAMLPGHPARFRSAAGGLDPRVDFSRRKGGPDDRAISGSRPASSPKKMN